MNSTNNWLAKSTLTPFPYPIAPMNNTTPLTMREGITFQGTLERLRHWLENNVIPGFEGIMESAYQDFVKGLENAENTVVENRLEWQKIFNDFIQNFQNEVKALNDEAIAQLVQEGDSATGQALKEIFADSNRMQAIENIVNSGRLSETGLSAVIDNEVAAHIADEESATYNALLAAVVEPVNDITGPLKELAEDTRNKIDDHVYDHFAGWKNAVQNQSGKIATVVNLGSSTAGGGIALIDQKKFFWRLSALYTDNPVLPINGEVMPGYASTGVQMFDSAQGGMVSANYLSDNVIARIGNIKPNVILHMIGINDANSGVPVSTFNANVRGWLNKIRLVSPDSLNVYLMQKASGGPWQDYLNVIRDITTEYNYPFINMEETFKNVGPSGNDRYGVMMDSLHFGDLGNRLMTDLLAEKMGAPKTDWWPRELHVATAFNGGAKTTGEQHEISKIIVKRKPYVRDAVVNYSMYVTASAGLNDMKVFVRPVGGAHGEYGVHRLLENMAPHTEQDSAVVTLLPNIEYEVVLILNCYSGGSNATVSSNSAFMRFTVDASPA